MSVPASRASELAAAQVEQIVAAAHEAAEKIRGEAEAAREEARRAGERDAEAIRAEARERAEAGLHEARKQAILLTQDARRDAEGIISDAKEQVAQIRERTQRAVDGRVAAAERSAADVLEEARALSGGLHQLGRSLEDHAERILREVQAAHKRMQAELRVSSEPYEPPREESASELFEGDHEPVRARRGDEERAPRTRPNPIKDLEVPSWVAPDAG